MDDVERAIDDAVNTYKALTKDARLLAGAGAVEIELARRVEKIGETCAGLEQYAIKKFAHSLETLPKAIAENAGHSVRVINALIFSRRRSCSLASTRLMSQASKLLVSTFCPGKC